jgi:hypothetical protein
MRYVALLVVLVGCKGDSGSSGVGSGSASGSGSSAVAGSGSVGSGSSSSVAAGSGSSVAAGSGSAAPPKLDPKVMAARCDEPCLFLLDTAVDKLGDAYKTACHKDMPDLELTDCAKLDQIRKCVFAAHGFVFKQARWKKAYDKKSWYVANPAFRPTQITELEHANVVDLDARAKACKKGITVTPADVNRVRSWLAAFDRGKPALPKVIHVNGETGTADEAVALLHHELDSLGLKKIRLGANGNTVSYDDEGVSADLFADLKMPSEAKLRPIVVEQSTTNAMADAEITEGVRVHLIYDDHDTLVAVDVSHFLWD